MSHVPLLTDDVVTLRAHRDDDIARLLEQCVDEQTVRWTTVPTPYTRDDAATFVRHVMPGGWASEQEWGFAVEHEGRYAGTVTLRRETDHRAEVAFAAHPDARGTGAMERALRLLLTWGFTERGLSTIVWFANVGNVASRSLVRRVGFSFDGTLRGYLDHRGTPTDAWAGTLLRGEPMRPRS